MGFKGLKRRKGQAKNRVHVVKKSDEDANRQEIAHDKRQVAKKKSSHGKTTALALNPQQQKGFERQVHVLKKKNNNTKESVQSRPGTIYLGHIPPGFFELEMKRFFSQFGRVTRLRLSRSKHIYICFKKLLEQIHPSFAYCLKTGRSKGYAFIEFELEEVAKVVAETMNNYLFYERLLKCEFLEPERVHPATFYGANRIFTKPIRFEVLRYNKEKNKLQLQRMCSKLLSKPRRLKKKMATHGINYDFPGLVQGEIPLGAEPEKNKDEGDDDDDKVVI